MSHTISIIAIFLLSVSSEAFKYGNILYDHEAATMNGKCLVKYINRMFDSRMVFAYRNSDEARDLTQLVVSSLLVSGNLAHGHNVEVLSRLTLKCGGLSYLPHSQYVVYINKVLGLPVIFERYLCFEWPITSRFIIVSNRTTVESVDEMLRMLRYYLVFKAVLITSWNETTIIYYRARPRCANSDYVDEPVTYHCSLEKDDQLMKPFVNIGTIPKCDLKVGVRIAAPYIVKDKDRHSISKNYNHTYTGIEMLIVYDVLGTEPTVGSEGPVIVRDLTSKRLDFIGGALSINVLYPLITNSYPFVYSTLIAVVKKQHSLNWLGMFSMFSTEIWLFAGAASIVFTFTAYLLQCWHEGARNSPQIDTICMKLLTALFGKGMVIGRRYLRFLFMAWIWFVFVLRSSYEAQSILQYMGIDAMKELSTVNELCVADYKIFISVLVDSYFRRGLQLPSCFLSYDRFVSVNDPMLALEAASSPHVVAFMYKHTYSSNLPRFIDATDQQPFYVVKEPLYFTPFVFYFHRGDPLLRVFERRGMMMLESGLIAFYEKLLETVNQNRIHALIQMQDKHEQSLSVKDIKMLFYLYGCSVAVACAVLVLENMYYYFVNKYCEWLQIQLRNMDELTYEVK